MSLHAAHCALRPRADQREAAEPESSHESSQPTAPPSYCEAIDDIQLGEAIPYVEVAASPVSSGFPSVPRELPARHDHRPAGSHDENRPGEREGNDWEVLGEQEVGEARDAELAEVLRVVEEEERRERDNATRAAQEPPPMEGGRGWSCAVCTLQNPMGASSCSICGEVRPPDQPRVDRLLSPGRDNPRVSPRGECTPPQASSHHDQSMARARGSAVLGGLFGAILGGLQEGSFRGAVAGAAQGALFGGAMGYVDSELDQVRAQPRVSPAEVLTFQRQRHLAMGYAPDAFDRMSYEERLEIFGTGAEAVPAERRRVERLPTRLVEPAELASLPEDMQQCCICMDTNAGDVRTLPCMHVFHVRCIDEWLAQNGTCPICKTKV